MWKSNFKDRLQEWNRLRNFIKQKDSETALLLINRFWFRAPHSHYYLHWNDRGFWPDPWQLLNENIYCDVARGLGILYTIAFAEHAELTSAELVLTKEQYNLVLVEKNKYILNWEPNQIVNKSLSTQHRHSITIEDVLKKY